MTILKTISRSCRRSASNRAVIESRLLMRIEHEGEKGFLLSVMEQYGTDIEFFHYCSLESVSRSDAAQAENRLTCFSDGGKETKKAREKIEELLASSRELSYDGF